MKLHNVKFPSLRKTSTVGWGKIKMKASLKLTETEVLDRTCA